MCHPRGSGELLEGWRLEGVDPRFRGGDREARGGWAGGYSPVRGALLRRFDFCLFRLDLCGAVFDEFDDMVDHRGV
jgi:hypothetical protein